jgi:methyl acetate hydrolase
MGNDARSAFDGILQRVTTCRERVPGVVAMITDRSANIYEGAAGLRVLGSEQAMTLDSVFAIFSTTKPIAGTAVLQCVEDGKLDLDAPAKNYVPDIGKLQVWTGSTTLASRNCVAATSIGAARWSRASAAGASAR